MQWFLKALRQYATFSGRAQRSEYWFFALIYLVIYIVLSLLDAGTGTYSAETGIGLLSGIFSLALLLPSFAVTARRLHDTSRSGWWMLILLVPLIGAIVLIVFMVQDSTPGPNEYGPNPKGE